MPKRSISTKNVWKQNLKNVWKAKYLDIYEDSTQDKIKALCHDFRATQKILRHCAFWQKLITTQKKDLSFVNLLSGHLTSIKELCKYHEKKKKLIYGNENQFG